MIERYQPLGGDPASRRAPFLNEPKPLSIGLFDLVNAKGLLILSSTEVFAAIGVILDLPLDLENRAVMRDHPFANPAFRGLREEQY